MGDSTRIVFWVVLLCVFFSVQGADHKNRRYRDVISNQSEKCDFEAKLQRLEAHLDDKVNGIRRDIWSSSRSLEEATERLRRNYQGPDLEREMQVVIATLRLLSNDLAIVRQNLSYVVNATNAMKDQQLLSSSIDQIFKPSSNNVLTSTEISKTIPQNCAEIKPGSPSSVFLVQPKTSPKPFMVYCDMGYQGGWLVIHNRFTGDQDFYRDWLDYKMGFGNIAGEHWLGLEHLYQLTGMETHELRVELVNANNIKTFAQYSHFSIGSEEEGYALKVLGGFQGTAGDSLSYHAGSKFSTKDRDQDGWLEGNCAQSHGGAWWYKSCDKSNLNGRYLPGEQPDAFLYQPMYWGTFTGPQTGLKYARMMIRPRQ